MRIIDNFLNSITMYRLMLYYLMLLLVAALIYSFLGILPFSPFALLFSTLFIVGICWIANEIFSKTYHAPVNIESVYISGLILTLIISPIKSYHDLPFLFWASIWVVASKFIIAVNKKHIFNPVAFSIALAAFAINQSATWWVGTMPMLPFVLLGALIVRKIRRFDLVFYFFVVSFLTAAGFSLINGSNLFSTVQKTLFDTPFLFFAFVMLTEPLTTPPKKNMQSIYGAIVGFLLNPQIHIGSFYTTPELALIFGNIFSYVVSYKSKLILSLHGKIQIAPDTYDLVFDSTQKLVYLPGQYMEWTLPHSHPDSRGNRRYFTLASSPTEDKIRVGIKYYDRTSSFKKTLISMEKGEQIAVSQLAGDFIFPKNANEKLVFIAGGIGITPYRSMIKYLIDTNQKKNIILFYASSSLSDFVYKDVFDEASNKIGIKTVYIITNTQNVPDNWSGKVGYITSQMIEEEIPDLRERKFYLSGPDAMVKTYQDLLRFLHIGNDRIITDYFPGF